MRHIKNKINIVIMAILLFTSAAFSQNAPVTTIGAAYGAIGSTITVPVTVTGFTEIGAMTLRMYYNPTELTFVSTANANTALSADMLIANNTVNTTSAYIAVVWASAAGATLASDAKLFDVQFTLNVSSAVISFNNTEAEGTNCEYGNIIGDALIDSPSPLFYKNGLISIPSSEKEILLFSFAQQIGVTTVNPTLHTVTTFVPYGTSVAAISPAIVISPKATINPASGVARNFSNPVTYTVTAQDGSTQIWTVAIKKLPYCNPANAPKTVIGTVSATVGSQISVPVSTTGCFNNISSMSLRFYYNPTSLTYSSVSNINEAFTEDIVVANNIVNETSAYVAVVWAQVNGETIDFNTKLFDLDFMFITSPASIYFNNIEAEGNYCEWGNSNGMLLNDLPSPSFYTNGVITDINYVANTKVRTLDCGTTVAEFTKYIYCDAVMGATNYQWEFTADNFSFTRVRGTSSTNFLMSWVTGIEYGTTYNVKVRAFKNNNWGNYSSVCQITTGSVPSTKVKSTQCGTVLTSMNTNIFCDIVNKATQYQWKFENHASNFMFERVVLLSSTALNVKWITGIEFGKTYDVSVRAKVGNVWGSYGNICQITTPTFPVTKLKAIYCATTLTTLNQYLYCEAVTSASDYEWYFMNANSEFSVVVTRGSGSNSLLLKNIGLLNNSTYYVSMRAKIGNQWGEFGEVCPIIVQTTTAKTSGTFTVNNASSGLEINVAPNPVKNGNSINISVQADVSVLGTSINVYNIIGQKVYSTQISDDSKNCRLTISPNNRFSSGLHIIQAEINGEVKITKFVIE